MIVTDEMRTILSQLEAAEGVDVSTLLSLQENELGIKLIALSNNSKNRITRRLIQEFMLHAGVVWQRKLILRDTSPVASSDGFFATMDDYLGLLSANDNGFQSEKVS